MCVHRQVPRDADIVVVEVRLGAPYQSGLAADRQVVGPAQVVGANSSYLTCSLLSTMA